MTRLSELDPADCVSLLGTARFGRLVYTENAMPAIRPVNFRIDGESVVIRTHRGGRMASLPGTVVAFEADDIDVNTRTGWSVVIVGKAEAVTSIDELVALADPATRPWPPGPKECFLRVGFGRVTGRRLMASDDAA